MKRFLKILSKFSTLWIGFIVVIAEWQINAYEWTIKTTADALNEKDIKKINNTEFKIGIRETKKSLKMGAVKRKHYYSEASYFINSKFI